VIEYLICARSNVSWQNSSKRSFFFLILNTSQ